MSRGYFTFAQGPQYVRMAYALALSLRGQSSVKGLCIATDRPTYDGMADRDRAVFDKIVVIEDDKARDAKWKLENWCDAIDLTPYDETVCLDADMLFFEDVSSWWGIMSAHDVRFRTVPITYRGERITSDFYRKTFTENALPNVHTAFFYFKRDSVDARSFFDESKKSFRWWEEYYTEFLLPRNRPRIFSSDVSFAIAAKVTGLGYERPTTPTFVHMKSNVQRWSNEVYDEDWRKYVSHVFTSECELRVANFRQKFPFHYYVKEFLTDEVVNKLEKRWS